VKLVQDSISTGETSAYVVPLSKQAHAPATPAAPAVCNWLGREDVVRRRANVLAICKNRRGVVSVKTAT
jgi:hypothetical protein